MAFDASIFRNELKTRPAGANLFYIEIEPPKIFSGFPELRRVMDGVQQKNWSETFRALQYFSEATDLPGRQVASIRSEHHGPAREIPNKLIYNTQNINFIETNLYQVRELFDAWQEAIFSNADNKLSYRVPYYEDIVSPEIRIIVFSPDGNVRTTYHLKDAYPVAVGASSVSWANQDQYMTVPIEFSYHRWTKVVEPTVNAGDGFNTLLKEVSLKPSGQSVINQALSKLKEGSVVQSLINDAFGSIVNQNLAVVGVLGNKLSASVQSTINQAGNLITENAPPILQPALKSAQSLLDQSVNKALERQTNKLRDFF